MLKKVCLIVIFFLFILSPQKVFAGTIAINEIFVHPSSGNDEWVELYNPDNTDLTGYFIDDDTNFTDDIGSSKKALTSITNGTYAVFSLSSAMFNNSGDFVVLFDPSGNIIDQHEYTNDPGIDTAIGRSPDGSGSFAELVSSTQGSANSGLIPTATLTPTQIPTPTRTPTPTKVPTPTPLRPTSHSATRDSEGQAATKTLQTITKSVSPTTKESKKASAGAYPTVVLAASISAEPTAAKKSSDEKVLVKESNNIVMTSSLIIGGLLLAACAILVYRRIKHETSLYNE